MGWGFSFPSPSIKTFIYDYNLYIVMRKKIKIVKCNRCNHEWVLRKKSEPKWCPRCRSPYWNKPRIRLGGRKKWGGKLK